MRLNGKAIALAVVVVAAGAGLWWWWQLQSAYPSTDDAYVRANLLTIAPQVGGQISSVAVTENMHVQKGDTLFQIDTVSLQAALDSAQAQLDTATQSVRASQTDLGTAQASVVAATANLKNLQGELDRTQKLFDSGDVTKAALDQATAQRDQAAAQQKSAQAALSAMQDQAGAAGADNPSVRAAAAALTIAKANLAHATVTAPESGWISNLSLRPGQIVAAGQALFSLVEDSAWWVDANFKETDLARIHVGQPATLSFDMYPGLKLKGSVVSLGAASGAVFSLLPAQNATGNWVKVTQRFPVRISLPQLPTDPDQQLRVGASAKAVVDTTQSKTKTAAKQ
ncbi:HlyD family secretion protein [Devosia sp.]|uniref:HlyD family secretion protein n=1 Tax=Devosia sp. TaxID=1871048 RepID=UPI003A8DFDD0